MKVVCVHALKSSLQPIEDAFQRHRKKRSFIIL